MITKRIIPCLDVKDGRVVKGVNFMGLSDVSSPVELARYYSDCGADELVFYDITASAEGRRLFTDVLREVALRPRLVKDENVVLFHFCDKAPEPRVEGGESPCVSVYILSVTEEHIKVNEVCEHQT